MFNVSVPPEWRLTFDVRHGSFVSSSWTNILQVSALDGSGHFPSVWYRASRRKIHVRYGPSSYVEVNQHPNPSGGSVQSIEITLQAGRLTMAVNGVLQSQVATTTGVCASGCPTGDRNLPASVYFCKAGALCADLELKRLRLDPL